MDILKFVFMSARNLSDSRLKIARQHPAVMQKVQSSFLPRLMDTTPLLSEVWEHGGGKRRRRRRGEGAEVERKR